jgi:hypothetical protein
MVSKILPIFKGYTVDIRLRQFRKVVKQKIYFIDFDTNEGEELLNGYIKNLNLKEFKEFIRSIQF